MAASLSCLLSPSSLSPLPCPHPPAALVAHTDCVDAEMFALGVRRPQDQFAAVQSETEMMLLFAL